MRNNKYFLCFTITDKGFEHEQYNVWVDYMGVLDSDTSLSIQLGIIQQLKSDYPRMKNLKYTQFNFSCVSLIDSCEVKESLLHKTKKLLKNG